MKLGQLRRRSVHPAPVGRPDYYRRELHADLFIRSAQNLPERSFLSLEHREPSAHEMGQACHTKYGVYPLNFSFPQPDRMPGGVSRRAHFLSTTIPGEPFSFDSWDLYLEEYRSSFFSLSTKKGGWDTFRHLEILFSGGIPLTPGLASAHPYALAHYPKRAMATVLENLLRQGPALPDSHTREFFRSFSATRLTTEAMATYLVEASGMSDSRVLYLDHGLARRTDYLSAFTLIGLRQLLGSRLIPAYEANYLLDDFAGDTHRLYGKGFGYTKVLPASLTSTESLSPEQEGTPVRQRELIELAESCESIVVGNYDGNREQVGALLDAGIPASRFVCILGSDVSPDWSLRAQMRRSAMTFFVREFPGR
jgi:hypothetical protein